MATILKNEPLWNKTTFRIGGPADTLVIPEGEEELARWMTSGEVALVLGGGANLLVSDEGVRGVVLSLREGFCDVAIDRHGGGEVTVRAQAGVGLTKLSGTLMNASVAGFEFAYGIPGLLGGALIMNAGTRDREMKDVVESVRMMTTKGDVRELGNEECGFSYRSSSFPEKCVIIEAAMKLREGERERIHETMRRYQFDRMSKQPLQSPNAGSVFKNPEGDYAGRLIDAAGLKGTRVGGAEVSGKHANFIINTGGARARDVYELMRIIERRVRERFGVTLEREVRLVGDFGE